MDGVDIEFPICANNLPCFDPFFMALLIGSVKAALGRSYIVSVQLPIDYWHVHCPFHLASFLFAISRATSNAEPVRRGPDSLSDPYSLHVYCRHWSTWPATSTGSRSSQHTEARLLSLEMIPTTRRGSRKHWNWQHSLASSLRPCSSMEFRFILGVSFRLSFSARSD